jgi:DNA-binding NarL/FixJ family response regulator
MSPRFYQCATPYRLGELYQKYPKLYLAVISIGEFPADVALRFVANGVKAFVCTADGIEQFNVGLEAIRNRKPFIPSFVQERIDLRKEYPAPSRMLTPIMTEVLRCICNGFCKEHIADTLSISERTVEKHRQELYRSLNARTPYDLYRNAQQQGFVTIDELDFCHRNLECTPLPEKHKKKKAKAVH